MNILKKWIRSSLNFKHVIVIVAAVLCSVAATILFTDLIASICEYQSFLNSRNYNYSVVIDKNIGANCYALYGKTITFSKNVNLDSTINVTSLMKTDSDYDNDDFLFNYEYNLLADEVLISKNIALTNGIKVGTILYSRNRINNKVDSFTVMGLIPDIYGVSEKDNDMTKGVIVVGKNDDLLKNIQTNFIYFYHDDNSLVNKHGANITGDLTNIKKIYNNAIQGHIFYSLIISCILILTTAVAYSLLISFNLTVYLKKKEYGVLNLYKMMYIDFFIYVILILFFTISFYLIAFFWSRFSIELFLALIIYQIIGFLLSQIILRRKILRR